MDGTLSPVSFKGGMDTLDNDTSGRRKVCTDSLESRLKMFKGPPEKRPLVSCH